MKYGLLLCFCKTHISCTHGRKRKVRFIFAHISRVKKLLRAIRTDRYLVYCKYRTSLQQSEFQVSVWLKISRSIFIVIVMFYWFMAQAQSELVFFNGRFCRLFFNGRLHLRGACCFLHLLARTNRSLRCSRTCHEIPGIVFRGFFLSATQANKLQNLNCSQF